MQYLIRSVKYLITLVVFFAIVFTLMYYTSTNSQQLSFQEFIERSFAGGAGYKILIFFIVFAAIYPIIGYSKKNIYVSNYKDNHSKVKEFMQGSKFVVENETPTRVPFRAKGAGTRVLRMGEDRLTINFSEIPIVTEGQSKDGLRFSRWLVRMCQDAAGE